jgi:hypothetical protein
MKIQVVIKLKSEVEVPEEFSSPGKAYAFRMGVERAMEMRTSRHFWPCFHEPQFHSPGLTDAYDHGFQVGQAADIFGV